MKEDHLVLADLGSCKGIYSKPPFTEYISTRWYRAPECLLTNGYYNYKVNKLFFALNNRGDAKPNDEKFSPNN